MIQVIQGFKLSTRDAVDNRIVLTKAEMVAIKDTQMPDKYFAICKDDGLLYIYDKSKTTSNDETGKFSIYSYSKIEAITIDGVEIPITDKTVDIPISTSTVVGVTKLYDTVGNNTDGTMSQKVICEEIAKKFNVTVGSDEDIIFTSGT